MKRIGFVGSQSMHVVFFGNILLSGVPGLDSSSGHLWAPDKPSLLIPRLAQGELKDSCASLDELIEISDAIMILLRDGESHREIAETCMRKGKPVFVDKPFASIPEDAAAILAAARAYQQPIMGGSTLCWLPEVKQVAALKSKLQQITLRFKADCDSPHGGWNFYGSHLTDLCAAIAGCDALSVSASRKGSDVEVNVQYNGFIVRLMTSPEIQYPEFIVQDRDGRKTSYPIADYERCYRQGMERFSKMLRDGKSVHPERLLFSTQLLYQINNQLSRNIINTAAQVI